MNPTRNKTLSPDKPLDDAIEWLREVVAEAESGGYYGQILLTLDLKGGRITGAQIDSQERRHVTRHAS